MDPRYSTIVFTKRRLNKTHSTTLTHPTLTPNKPLYNIKCYVLQVRMCRNGFNIVVKGNTERSGTSSLRGRTYPGMTSPGASSDGVLLRNKPVPNSTRFIGELYQWTKGAVSYVRLASTVAEEKFRLAPLLLSHAFVRCLLTSVWRDSSTGSVIARIWSWYDARVQVIRF